MFAMTCRTSSHRAELWTMSTACSLRAGSSRERPQAVRQRLWTSSLLTRSASAADAARRRLGSPAGSAAGSGRRRLGLRLVLVGLDAAPRPRPRRGCLARPCLGCRRRPPRPAARGLHRLELLLGRQLAALGHDERLAPRRYVRGRPRSAPRSGRSRLIGSSSSILRRSTRIFCCSQSSSAMSVGVTEPNSEPVGPAFTSKRSSVLPEPVGDLAAPGRASAPRGALAARRACASSATFAGVAASASRRGSRKFRA